MAIYKEVDELLKAMDTWDKFGVSFGLLKLSKSNEKDYVPYVRYEDMVQAVTGTPHADVAPVVHAYWKWDENGMDWNLGAWVCSECGMSYADVDVAARPDINVNVWACSNFCGHCGAIMDKEKEG